ncbi:MAG: DUF11 domain-containing protein [Clostridia bacterium]|nr:DUF11 domain-containing protein [Clostridia bacterium]
MKRVIALLLGALTILTLFAACGEKAPATDDVTDAAQTEETAAAPSGSETAAPADTQTETQTPDEEPHYKQYDDPRQEAVCVYAESMYLRKTYAQYDDTRLVPEIKPAEYRWQRNVMACEDYTKQLTGYTNCAAFCYDCYFNALDYDIKNWSTAAMIQAPVDQLFYTYNVKGNETPEDFERLKKEFSDNLQPADIIVYRYTGDANGHAMLYVGDGRILHSMALNGGNYNYSEKKEYSEPKGTVTVNTVDDLFTPGHTRCLLEKAFIYGILRPLNVWNGQVPEKSRNRVKNLQNVVVQKLCSKTIGQVIEPGEELTYTFEIANTNNWKMELEVRDVVPENTTYVSGADSVSGKDLSWKVTVPKGERATVSYTVKVNDDPSLIGKTIFNDKATVGGVPCKTPALNIGKHLTDEEKTKMENTMNANVGSDLSGALLAAKIYKDAVGLDLSSLITDNETVFKSVFELLENSRSFFSLKKNSRYFGMIAPTMYGGYYVVPSDAFGGVRTRGPMSTQLEAGDVVFMSQDTDNSQIFAYMVSCSNTLLSLNPGDVRMLDMLESKDVLMSTLGYNKFVILRPAMLLK